MRGGLAATHERARAGGEGCPGRLTGTLTGWVALTRADPENSSSNKVQDRPRGGTSKAAGLHAGSGMVGAGTRYR